MFEKISKLSIKAYSGCNFNCVFCHQLLDDKHKPYVFDDYDNLQSFIEKLPLDNFVDVTITGGEITLADDLFRKIVSIFRKIEKYIDVKFDICVITNGSNMNLIYKWINERLVVPYKVSISWDGIHNSWSRKSCIKDEYYLNEIKTLGKSAYNNDISIVHSINPETIDYLYDSFKYCYENNCFNIGYYFIHEANYSHLIDKFKYQIEKIAQLVIDYMNKGYDVYYYNWQHIHTSLNNKNNFFLCNKLGYNYHIDMFGDIYPCIYFGDHRTFCLGNIKDGIDKNKLNLFIDNYLRYPNCDYKKCQCYHCSECPASNYVHNHSLSERFKNICELQKIEIDIFKKYSPMIKKYDSLFIPNDIQNKHNTLVLKDCLSCVDNNTGIISPNYNNVKSW